MRQHGEGSTFLRGKRWWIAYRHRGQLYRESSKSTSRRVATTLLRKRLSELAAGRHAPEAERVTLTDLRRLVEADQRLNSRRATNPPRRAWQRLEDHFGSITRAVDVTSARLTGYAAARANDGVAPATFSYELSILRRGFTLALRDGLLHRKPAFPSIRLDNVRTGFATEEDIQALLKELPEYARGPVRFAAISGWRLASEVLPLRWAQVTADEIRLEVGSTKSGEARAWPRKAHPELARLIETQRAHTREVERQTGQIIPWVWHREGKQIRSISEGWKGACKRAGLRLIPHDLRRSAVRRLEWAGVPRGVAMKLVGHKSESMYRRYAVVAQQDLSDGVARLAAYHGAAPSEAPSSVLPLRATEG